MDLKERKNKSDEVSLIANYATKNDDERKKKAKQKEELFLTIDRVLSREKPHHLSQTCYQHECYTGVHRFIQQRWRLQGSKYLPKMLFAFIHECLAERRANECTIHSLKRVAMCDEHWSCYVFRGSLTACVGKNQFR